MARSPYTSTVAVPTLQIIGLSTRPARPGAHESAPVF